jgi:hypothetical protein
MRPNDANAVTIAGGAVGVVLLVLGLVSLARTGIPGTLLEPAATVGPFTRTPLMAVIELILGVVLIGASATADRRGLTAIGLIALVIGLVWVIEPAPFQTALGVGRESAILYLLIGGICLAAGLLRPGGAVRERRVHVRR